MRALTGGRGADVVFNTSGMMFADSVEAAAGPDHSRPARWRGKLQPAQRLPQGAAGYGVDTRQLDVVACAKFLAAMEGGGEFLAHAIGDWENFMADRPKLEDRKAAGQDPAGDLHEVATILVKNNWPLRQHSTYGESVKVVMDVFEQVKKEQGKFAPRWAIDHAETIRDEELERVKAMGGGIAIQNRMAFAGEYFAKRYGKEAAAYAPPVRKMLRMGIPVGAGTDGTRVSSYNPWPSLYWLVTGKTVGGMQLFADDNKLTREEALRVFTAGSAWFSQEEDVKGRIAPGQYADFAVLTADYFSVPEEQIKNLESVLTVVGGKVVYAAEPFQELAPPPLPPVSPSWSPVAHFGGYQNPKKAAGPRRRAPGNF